jgi:trk system potassium uptake protein TrkA
MATYAVIGLGRFGYRLATLLADSGAEVIAIDRKREIIEAIRDRVTVAVCLDSTDEDALRAQGVDEADVAVVGIASDFEDGALTTVTLKQMGVPHVISRATTSVRGQILARIGADDVVNPERESAERWRNRLLAPRIMESIELAEGYSLAQVPAPKAFAGKTLEQLQVRKRYRLNVVAIRRTAPGGADGAAAPRQMVITVPMADTTVQAGDVLVVVGDDAAIRDLPGD